MSQAVQALLVYPRFEADSFWNYVSACELTGAKYPSPPLGMMTLAARLPSHWDIRLVDINVKDLTDTDLDWADVVMVGAMLPQQRAALDVLDRCRLKGIATVVGGPDLTSSPEIYGRADMLVLGEVEGIIDEFVTAFEAGQRSGRWDAPKFTADITKTPVPRFDLIRFGDYVDQCVQFSRGCPFLCEFCDIIELYGRAPRTKTAPQMLAELQALYDLGHRGVVQIVDDNLVGNKKAVMAFLPQLIEWQKERGYPFEFATEASLNMADDPALLALLRDACFVTVFIGIESPDPDVLIAARKKQNTRRDITADIHRIQSYGMFVLAGFILGMDHEKPGTGTAIGQLIDDCAIPVAMAGLLHALPTTQLTRRLEREGRLMEDYAVQVDDICGDQCTAGLNFEPLRPEIEILREYRDLIRDTYDQDAFFSRVRKSVARIDGSGVNGQMFRSRAWIDLKNSVRTFWIITTRHKFMRGHFWRIVLHTARRNPEALKHTIYQAALYTHLGPFSEYVIKILDARIAKMGHEATTPAEVAPPRPAIAAVESA